jgi:hypothetical protein
MDNECHFCRGIVSLNETADILLDGHADHEVFLHEQCAAGHDLIEEPQEPADGPVEVTCPKCGVVESV